MDERIIHIKWTGPHRIDEITAMTGPADKGLYQVYAHHPIYGRSLVYIGQTFASFGSRIPRENREGGSENDPKSVEYYVGRLIGAFTPSSEQWQQEIKYAESLLIHAHGPAYNSTNIEAVNEADPGVQNVRVLNWGAVRSLSREVSGLMWSSRGTEFQNRPFYGDAPSQPEGK
jgi:hypothetical protein